MTDAGHPSRHGRALCVRCGVWQMAANVEPVRGSAQCLDVVWCNAEIERRGRNRAEFARSHPDSPVVVGEGEDATAGQPGSLGGIPRGPVLNGEHK